MRVLLVSHGFPPEGIAGVERYTEGLAHELVAAGDEVSVATGASGERCELVRGRSDGAAVYRLTRPKFPREHFLRHACELERLFAEVLEETAPEVVHVNHVMGLSPRFLELAHRAGAAVVLSLWDYYFVCSRHQLTKRSGEACAGPDGGRACASTCFAAEGHAAAARWTARTAYFALLLRTAERLVCPSRYVASYFERFVENEQRLRLLPLGLPRPLQTARGSDDADDDAPLHVVVLGQVFENKGAHVVLEALELAALGSARLSVHGRVVEPAYAEALERRAVEIPGVELTLGGPYETEDLAQRLRGVDCVVVPSQWPETFAFVAREALAHRIPVLAARIGGLPEAIDEGANGFTFRHDRPGELAAILRRLDGDRGLLRRLSSGAARRPPLAPSEHARAVRAVYREAVDDFARGGATTAADREELDRLERRLVRLGFDGGRP
jgi:glycosyltransferase involved in cell wall biosynthesis